MDFLMSVLSALFKVDEEINNTNRNGQDNSNIEVLEDIEYSETQVLDAIYDANVSQKYPVLINVHGGGWMVGDKKWRRGIASMYAENGFFVLNPNYSLSPQTRYPECIRDIFDVLDWVDKNAYQYNLDKDKIYITGDSAGAHIAAVVAGMQNNVELLDKMGVLEPVCKIKKVALFCGVYDFDKCISKPGAQGLVKEMTSFDFWHYKDEFAFYGELSPINLVDDSFPPTYMVSAPFDIFCDGQAERLIDCFNEHNIPYTLYVPEDKLATHCFHLNLNRTDSLEAINGAINFLKSDENDAKDKENKEDNSSVNNDKKDVFDIEYII